MQKGHITFLDKRRGFTIIELLTVLVIIGVLSSLAASSYVNAQKNARDNSRKTNVNNIATAVETYYRTNQSFPGLISSADWVTSGASTASAGCAFASGGTNYNIAYYYSPVSTGNLACGSNGRAKAPVATGAIFSPDDYVPATSWIPKLGSFMNPIPIERRYKTNAGTGPINLSNDPKDDPIVADSDTQTLVYRHLKEGYVIYTRLENSSSDTVPAGTSYISTSSPKYANGDSFSVANSKNVYLIIK